MIAIFFCFIYSFHLRGGLLTVTLDIVVIMRLDWRHDSGDDDAYADG